MAPRYAQMRERYDDALWRGDKIPMLYQRLDFFAELQETRSCQLVNVAAGREATTLEFVKLLEGPIDNAGLLDTFRDRERLPSIKHEIITVPVEPLSEILRGVPVVHYLDIDVEGHELEVLQGIDFSRVEIRVIGVEAGDQQGAIDDLLAEHGFRPFMQLYADRFYSQRFPSAPGLYSLP